LLRLRRRFLLCDVRCFGTAIHSHSSQAAGAPPGTATGHVGAGPATAPAASRLDPSLVGLEEAGLGLGLEPGASRGRNSAGRRGIASRRSADGQRGTADALHMMPGSSGAVYDADASVALPAGGGMNAIKVVGAPEP